MKVGSTAKRLDIYISALPTFWGTQIKVIKYKFALRKLGADWRWPQLPKCILICVPRLPTVLSS